MDPIHKVYGSIKILFPSAWSVDGENMSSVNKAKITTGGVMKHAVTADAWGVHWPRKNGKVHLTFEICLKANKHDGEHTKP